MSKADNEIKKGRAAFHTVIKRVADVITEPYYNKFGTKLVLIDFGDGQLIEERVSLLEPFPF